ncbi:Retrovirus-related Pol polyprotein from type-1 retrotransposable element R2 [Smittium culicis]|uniref:Retrovirus-related Pol polyprotein from type-1 retrotransposable element R2 n=1 Tax=Smittium culicis TaxID=133412 RepID=A0A1R1X450_9FUNG|nr:Retrovirus-related Pol polyprotein from type-1 retrotransposable element R2 [Smittium culicis]
MMAKIVASKLTRIEKKYKLLVKEQAGFRNLEECAGQATTLYEIIHYSKAYDRVPHMALLHKLRAMGIGGKLLHMITGMYRTPKIVVRVGNTVSNYANYHCGVRQGCPASPILFDFYINDIFEGIEGVDVPGLPNRIPGLLFADDAVVLADSPENLQISLDKISTWSDTWEMKVNAAKCARSHWSKEKA